MIDSIYAVFVAILLVLFVLSYWLTRLYKVVQWIIKNVRIVPSSQDADPEYVKIRKFFGIEEEVEQGK